jgi:hypothetical protein
VIVREVFEKLGASSEFGSYSEHTPVGTSEIWNGFRMKCEVRISWDKSNSYEKHNIFCIRASILANFGFQKNKNKLYLVETITPPPRVRD